MVHPKHLRELIINPTLKHLGMYSEAASNLMMGTAAQESHMGKYLMQIDVIGNPVGPALGIYQIEPETHKDIWRYLDREDKKKIRSKVMGVNSKPVSEAMIHDMKYATAMARIKYWMVPEALPEADDIEGLSGYYKKYYNTSLGAGSRAEFSYNYRRFVTNGN